MKRSFISMVIVAVVCFSQTILADGEAEDGWIIYRSETYGFSMLSPKGAEYKEMEWDGGWAGLVGHYEGVVLHALTKKEIASAEEIQIFAVKVTGVAAEHWELVEEADEDENGWQWYQAYRASEDLDVAYAGIGVGPKGSYLFVLETDVADDLIYSEAYEAWYQSLSVFE